MRIGIIGAGIAGVEAARVIRQAGMDVVLLSDEPVVPYFRPKLVAYAFKQLDFAGIQIRPAAWYAEQGIDLRLGQGAESVAADALHVRVGETDLPVDALVVATGAAPLVPPCFPRDGRTILPLWHVEQADSLRAAVGPGQHWVLVGGGILGIEAALRAVEAGLSVTLVELQDRLMSAQLGPAPAAALAGQLRARGVEVRLGVGVSAAVPHDTGVSLTLSDGDRLAADLCLLSIGARPDRSLAQAIGLKLERGIVVDEQLRTSRPGVFATGDAIQCGGVTRCSMREAMNQGRTAGHNAVALLRGEPLRGYQPDLPLLTLNHSGCELYSAGELGGAATEERILDGATAATVRVLVLREGRPVGVQMVGTREGFDTQLAALKQAAS